MNTWEKAWEAISNEARSGGQGAATKVRRRSDGKIGALKQLHTTHLNLIERRYPL
jgi:hypothetical protein